MKSSRANGMQIRRACGCHSADDTCDCDDLSSPDPWEVAGEDVNLNRQAETRAYRQSKFRD